MTWVEPLGMYVMAYAAWSPDGPDVALAISEDLFSWRRLGPVVFDPDPDPVYGVDLDVYHNRDAAFFPGLVPDPHGRPSLAMIHRPVYTEEDVPRGVTELRPSIWISYCPLEAAQRDIGELVRMRTNRVLIDPEHSWEELRIGSGTPPLRTPLGWLLIYHGASGFIPTDPSIPKNVRYTAGALVLDEADPLKVLYRSKSPILEPVTGLETRGIVLNVVFPTGIDDRGDGVMDVYYGMADERIGVVRLHMPAELPRSP